MALVACPECRNEVSSDAFACPKCGKPLKSPWAVLRPMGKRALVLWVVLIVMFLAIWQVLQPKG
jgi:predicted amidophosphoribosyltransferase